ncbi:MAG: YraN family protein [Nocardioides sp.]|nr:YraN family protein [Nocardioides sp.]
MGTGQNQAQRQALGAFGEAAAARYLLDHGMVLVDHNWRCAAGEIDLVLRDGKTLVFCEVKTRRSASFGSPFEAVTPAKAARIRRLGAMWMECHDVHAVEVRLDMVGIICPRLGTPQIDHVPGVG